MATTKIWFKWFERGRSSDFNEPSLNAGMLLDKTAPSCIGRPPIEGARVSRGNIHFKKQNGVAFVHSAQQAQPRDRFTVCSA